MANLLLKSKPVLLISLGQKISLGFFSVEAGGGGKTFVQNLGQNSCKVSCQKFPENRKAYLVGVLGSEDLCFCSVISQDLQHYFVLAL